MMRLYNIIANGTFSNDELLALYKQMLYYTDDDSKKIAVTSAITNLESLINQKQATKSNLTTSNSPNSLLTNTNLSTDITLKKRAQIQIDRYKKQYSRLSRNIQKSKFQSLLTGFQRKSKTLK